MSQSATLLDRADDLRERATEMARHGSEEAMQRMGEWVTSPPMADRLGVTRAKRKSMLWGMAAGMALGVIAGMVWRMRQEEAQHLYEQELAATPPVAEGQIDLTSQEHAAATT